LLTASLDFVSGATCIDIVPETIARARRSIKPEAGCPLPCAGRFPVTLSTGEKLEASEMSRDQAGALSAHNGLGSKTSTR
jgi:hypothetical protein